MTAVSLDLSPTSRLSLQAVRDFYSQPLARRVLLASSILLTYGGARPCSGSTPSTAGRRAPPSTTGFIGSWSPRSASWP